MAMRTAAITAFAVLALGLSAWGSDTQPKKFHTGPSHPQHATTRTGEVGHNHSNASSVLARKSQSAREKEVERLEHQNTAHLQARSRLRTSKRSGQARRIHSETAGHSNSSIHFNYHSPHNQAARQTGGRKH